MSDITAEQQKCILRIKRCSPTSYYEILDLESEKTTCTSSQIKKSYHKLSLLIHPDKNKHPDAAEAFTKVLKAFEILSDPDLRKQHDLTGGDPQSRFGGASSSGRTPFGNAQNRQGAFPQGFAPAGFGGGVDITPEDLFRQFFGGGGGGGPFGGGGGGPFEQQFFFNMGGPGIRVNTFPGQQQRRRYAQAQGQDQAQQGSRLSAGTAQLLIFLLPFLFSIISYIFSGSTPSTPGYRFDGPVPPYTHAQTSRRLDIPYWVNPAEVSTLSRTKLRELDRLAEVHFMAKLDRECQAERVERERLMNAAHGWFFPDEDKMRQAKAYPMPSCAKLKAMRSK